MSPWLAAAAAFLAMCPAPCLLHPFLVAYFLLTHCLLTCLLPLAAHRYLDSILDSDAGTYLVFVLFSVQIPIFTSLFKSLAIALAESENHQTEPAFLEALIGKAVTFEFLNTYGPLLYQAFVKIYTYGCRDDCCMDDMAELLGFMFAVQCVTTAYGSLSPFAEKWYRDWRDRNKIRQAAAMKEAMADDDELDSESLVSVLEPWEKEMSLKRFPGFFGEYLTRVINFGLATMFVVALPCAPVITCVFTATRMRILAFQMCTVYQRPAPERVESIGLWKDVMSFMCVCTILCNCAILVFTSNTFRAFSWEYRVVIFLAMVQALLLVQGVVEVLVPTETAGLRAYIARHQYLIEKHIYGFQDMEAQAKQSKGSDGGAGGEGGAGSDASTKRGHIDLGPLEEQLLKKAESKVADGSFIPELIEVDAELEAVKRELAINKDRLVNSLKTEVYNEKTGIGETIHGLPLGCISLKLIMMEGVQVSSSKNVSVVISLKSTKRDDTSAPGPPAQVSKSGRANSNTRAIGIDFNQTFTLAPVKTHDAQLIFDIMDSGADPKRRGTCKIHLRDLADQLDSNKTLPVLVRSSDGRFEPDKAAKLFARVKFQYSKVLPLRTKIYELQDTERTLRAKKTALRLSKSKD